MRPKLSDQETVSLRHKLLYARWLYEKGVLDADRMDELSHLTAIMYFHNAIEIVVQNIVLSYRWATTGKMRNLRFDHLLSMMENKGGDAPTPPPVPLRTEIVRLAEMRGNIMHHGQRFHRAEVQDARSTCRRFLAEAVQVFFEEDLDGLSMTDLVERESVRQVLQLAEERLRAEQYAEAVAYCAVVVDLAQTAVATAFGGDAPDGTDSIRSALWRLRTPGPDDLFDGSLEEIGELIQAVVDRQDAAVLYTAGIDLDAARRFFALGFHVRDRTAIMDVERQFRVVRDGRVDVGPQDATYALHFATDVALKAQALGVDQYMTRLRTFRAPPAMGDWQAVDIEIPSELPSGEQGDQDDSGPTPQDS